MLIWRFFKNQDIHKYIPLFSSCWLFSLEALVARAWTSSDTGLNGPSWCSSFFVVGIPLVAITWREIKFPEFLQMNISTLNPYYLPDTCTVYQRCLAVHFNCVALRQNCIYFPFPDVLPSIKVNQCLKSFPTSVFRSVVLECPTWSPPECH